MSSSRITYALGSCITNWITFSTTYMKYSVYFALLSAVAVPASISAQSPIDAYNLSQTDMRGTARFMAMGGAFTALGGDLSTLNQNPAGIGVYRGSEVGITLDVNIMNSKTNGANSWNNTHADVNNFGYVGTYNFGGESVLQTFSWGVSYGRQKSFARQYRGGGMKLNTSMSNYIAAITDGTDPYKMMFYDTQSQVPDNLNIYAPYNPYRDSDIEWLSILGFSGGIINPVVNYSTDQYNQQYPYLTNIYNGLFQHPMNNLAGSPSSGAVDGFEVRERGYIDEYSINFGGNVANTLYWGLGIGIDDLHFEQSTYYAEYLKSANVPAGTNPTDGIVEGDCDWELNNIKQITGTGVNLKFGLIYKPINEFRIGAAIHTPTWYNLTTSYVGNIKFGSNVMDEPFNQWTDDAYYDWNLKSPWKLMIGAAGVIGGRAIISVDYQHDAYGSMKTSDDYGDFPRYESGIKSYFKATNTVRIGAEYRLTPQFSIRAGYNYTSTGVTPEAQNGSEGVEVLTGGTDPSYTFQNASNTISAGIGYRTGGFYIDFAYLHRHTDAKYHAFTNFRDYNEEWVEAPTAKVDFNSNQLVFTIGYKF